MPSPVSTDVASTLREAGAHLNRARALLEASPRDHVAVLDATLDSFRASLLAFLLGYGATPDPDAPLYVLAERAVRTDSVLKTVAHRAVLLVERAPAIRQAARPSIHDREDVETGWYTARNLYRTAAGQITPSRPSS
jgi:hypothetical protein